MKQAGYTRQHHLSQTLHTGTRKRYQNTKLERKGFLDYMSLADDIAIRSGSKVELNYKRSMQK